VMVPSGGGRGGERCVVRGGIRFGVVIGPWSRLGG
jgi:hypothetical protein